MKRRPVKWRTAAAFVAISILWGSAWIVEQDLLRSMPPLRAGAFRFALAAIFAGIVAVAVHMRSHSASRTKSAAVFPVSLLLGATAIAFPYALTGWAAGRVSPGAVAVLFALMPLASVLLSREIASTAIPVLVIGTGGVAFLVAQGVSFSTAQWRGATLIACAVVLGAFSLNYAKRCLTKITLLISVAIQFTFAALLLGVLGGVTERSPSITWNANTIVILLLLGVAVSGVTLPLLYWLLTEVEPWQAAALQWSATLVAVAESAWFLRARPSIEMWVGAALIIGATLWLLGATGAHEAEAVTLQITNHPCEAPSASESESGSR